MFDEIAELREAKATRRLQEIYAEPVKPDLIGERIAQIKDAEVTYAVAVTPTARSSWPTVLRAEPDLLVVQAAIVSGRARVALQSSRSTSRPSSATTSCPCWWAGARPTSRPSTSCAPAPPACWWAPAAVRPASPARCWAWACPWPPRWPIPAPPAHAPSTRRAMCHVMRGRRHRHRAIARAVACGAGAVWPGHAVAAATEAPGRELALEHAGGAPHPAPGRTWRRRVQGPLSRSCTGRRTTPRAWST